MLNKWLIGERWRWGSHYCPIVGHSKVKYLLIKTFDVAGLHFSSLENSHFPAEPVTARHYWLHAAASIYGCNCSGAWMISTCCSCFVSQCFSGCKERCQFCVRKFKMRLILLKNMGTGWNKAFNFFSLKIGVACFDFWGLFSTH